MIMQLLSFLKLGAVVLLSLFALMQAAWAGPATFRAKEEEKRWAELNSGGGFRNNQESIDNHSSLGAAPLDDPNLFCRNSNGTIIPGCSITNETEKWGGGEKKMHVTSLFGHGLRSDLNYSAGLASQMFSGLAGAVTTQAITFSYLDAAAFAGINSAQATVDGAVASLKFQVDYLNDQADRDPLLKEVVLSKTQGCIHANMAGNRSGSTPGNRAEALLKCLADRFSAGPASTTTNPTSGATMSDSPDHPGVSSNINTISLWNLVFQPMISSAASTTNGLSTASAAQYLDLLEDMRKIVGDTKIVEIKSTTGDSSEFTIERERNPNPDYQPGRQAKAMMRQAWVSASFVLNKYCRFKNDRAQISANYDPFTISSAFFPDFWSGLGSIGAVNPFAFSKEHLRDLTLAGGFRPSVLFFDILMSEFVNDQAHSGPPASGGGSTLNCIELSGAQNNYDTLLANGEVRLTAWRKTLRVIVNMIGTGQYLNLAREMRDTLNKTSTIGGAANQAIKNTAYGMIAEAVGLANIDQLEVAYANKITELRAMLDKLYQKHANKLGTSAGQLSEMFGQISQDGNASGAGLNPMASTAN